MCGCVSDITRCVTSVLLFLTCSFSRNTCDTPSSSCHPAEGRGSHCGHSYHAKGKGSVNEIGFFRWHNIYFTKRPYKVSTYQEKNYINSNMRIVISLWCAWFKYLLIYLKNIHFKHKIRFYLKRNLMNFLFILFLIVFTMNTLYVLSSVVRFYTETWNVQSAASHIVKVNSKDGRGRTNDSLVDALRAGTRYTIFRSPRYIVAAST